MSSLPKTIEMTKKLSYYSLFMAPNVCIEFMDESKSTNLGGYLNSQFEAIPRALSSNVELFLVQGSYP